METILVMIAPFVLASITPLIFKIIHWIEFRNAMGSEQPFKMIYARTDLKKEESTEGHRFMLMSNRITNAFFLILVLCVLLVAIEMICFF